MLAKDVIKKNFARCAHSYDRYADIQMRSALRLIDQIKEGGFSHILEVGCGTGNYTLLLRSTFPGARITGVDICKPMIELAQGKFGEDGVNFLVEDGEFIRSAERFDLITSNACLQWFSDLGKTIASYRDLSRDNGIIVFSTFGPHTLWELGCTLKEAYGKNVRLSSQDFLRKEELEQILNKNLEDVEVQEEIFEESYGSLEALLRKIKFTGERGYGASRIRFSQGLFRQIEDAFSTIFGQVKASYQIFYCRGKA